jgi:hypothetical protein
MLAAFAELRKATIIFAMPVFPPVRMEQLGSHWVGFVKFDSSVFFENLSRKLSFH